MLDVHFFVLVNQIKFVQKIFQQECKSDPGHLQGHSGLHLRKYGLWLSENGAAIQQDSHYQKQSRVRPSISAWGCLLFYEDYYQRP